MLETELNDSEPSGEERSGASSPEINTAEAGEVPAAKGRRRTTRRPARAKASAADAAPPDVPPAGPDVAPSGPDVAPSGPDAAGPSAVRFASPAARRPTG